MVAFGAILGPLGFSEGPLGAVMGRLGVILRPCRAVFGRLEAVWSPEAAPKAPEVTIHRPCPRSRASQVMIYRPCRGILSAEKRSKERAAKSRYIGPVDAPEPQGAQNSNSGGLEAAILDTFIIFGGLESSPTRDIFIF